MKPTLILSLLTLALGGGYAAHAAGLELPAALHNAVASSADATETQLFRVDSDGHSESGDDEGCGEDDDEGGATCNGAADPAPAGTTTPPSNGLFGDGKAPIVKSN
jgi:hypothetical protein